MGGLKGLYSSWTRGQSEMWVSILLEKTIPLTVRLRLGLRARLSYVLPYTRMSDVHSTVEDRDIDMDPLG